MLRTGMFLGDRYEIIEKIGSGGMADVYKAKCHKLNRMVAIKVLKNEFCNDKNFVSKFKAEAQAAAGLSHPNIVNIYDVGDEGEIHYIVMELVEGITLKQYIEKKGKLDIKESIGITIQIAQGINAAHEQHIIHRDIKPQNVIISRDGKVKVTDFGIAKAASSQTVNSEAVGSVYYFSPEQARGGYCDERSDIYSLGITLYEMLTGRVPFEGESTVAVALAHLQAEMVPPREIEPMIPISLDKIILKATQKKPERRYASASELISDLRKALMMPEEDFVKIMPANNTSPTLLISEDDISKIKQSKSITIADPDSKKDIKESIHDDSNIIEYDVQEDSDPEEEDDDKASVFDKVILGISIAIFAIILAFVVFFVSKMIKNISSPDPSQEESQSVEETSEPESTISNRQTIMPNVIGKSYDDAAKILKENSLGARREEEASETVEKGVVIRQQYEADSIVDKNINVVLTVSSGTSMIVLPNDEDMIGKLGPTVSRDLRQMGFEVRTESEYSTEVEEGKVIRVSPSGGTKLNKGDSVTVYVSLGEKIEYIFVPDLRGKTVDEADEYLKGTLVIGEVTEKYSDGTVFSEGQIMEQDLNVNDTVEKGSKVNIVISKGNEYVSVPLIEQKSKEDAEKALKDEGLELGEITEEYSDEVESGYIISQGIKAGEKAKIGDKISVVISKGVEMVKLPSSIAGEKAEMVKEELEELGFEVDIEEVTDGSVTEGYIISCNYANGTEVPYGSTIYLKVAVPPETEAPTETEPETTAPETTAAPTTAAPTTAAVETQAPAATTAAPAQATEATKAN